MADPASVAADAALAERVAQWARAGVTVENPSPALLRQSAALAEAAGRLDPGDREHPRLLADLELLAGDRDAALAALSALRRIDPGNETAGIQTIDLAANSIQTADGKVDYLTRIVDAGDALPAAVRSHAALLAGRARFDQGRDQESADLLDRALELNPVNVPALRARADRALSDPATAAPERVAVLLKLLEADPAQPAVIAAVADVLASVGLPAEAVEQYERAAKLGGAVGQPPSPNDYLNYAVQLMASGQARSAAEVGQALSQQSPGDPAPAMLALAATRQLGGEEAVTTGAEALRASLVEQLAELSSQAGGAGGPTPDYAADANRLAGGGSPDVASAYAAALVDLGWVDTFFLNRPAEPGVLDAAETLLGTQSPAVARLRGWSYLADGRTGEARVKLEAVADRDPLSAMGLILARAQEPSPDAADLSRRASDLVAGHRTGLVSALLRSGLRDFSPSPAPADDANAVRQAVAGFPRPLLDALDRGEPVRDLYQVTVERGKVAHAFGEPVTVDVTVRNTSPRPIALGDGGLVRSVVVADASVKGYDPQTFGAVAVERVRRAVVLPPGGQTSERVRVDQGPLRQYLLNAPGANVPIYVSVLTNAAFVRQGEGEEAREGYAVGPLGYRSQASVMERTGSPLNGPQAVQEAVRQLQRARGDEPVRAAELLTAYLLAFAKQEEPTDEVRQAAAQFSDALNNAAATDPSPAVRAYAKFLTANFADRAAVARSLIDSDDWRGRLLGVFASGALPPDERRAALQPLADGDADATVRKLAAATIDDEPAQPAEPTEEPAAEPTP